MAKASTYPLRTLSFLLGVDGSGNVGRQAYSASAIGLGNVDNTSDATKNAAVATLLNKTLTTPVITAPTGIVKADVGLGNVDNTSDATKNSASATLTNKTLTAPVINSPTGIVKADVGLGNVDNTSDATKNAASVTLTNKILNSPFVGSGGTTGNTTVTGSVMVINGSSASGGGGVIYFDKNSSYTHAFGNHSAITGSGTSDDLVVWSSTTGETFRFIKAGGVTVTGTINGVTLDNTAWTNFTPTMSVATGGTGLTIGGRYKVIGKTCFIAYYFGNTTAPTGAVSLSLPFTAAASGFFYYLTGREAVATGHMWNGQIQQTGTVVQLQKYDGTTSFSNGANLLLSGSYEIA